MFSSQLAALAWALPSVLVIAGVVVLLIKRVYPDLGRNTAVKANLIECTTRALSDTAHAHLLTVNNRQFLVIEAKHPVTIQDLSTPTNVPPFIKRMGPRT